MILKGVNALCLSRFTDKDTHVEANVHTRIFDLVVAVVQRRRFTWLDHPLHMGVNRIVKRVVKVQYE